MVETPTIMPGTYSILSRLVRIYSALHFAAFELCSRITRLGKGKRSRLNSINVKNDRAYIFQEEDKIIGLHF